jgi:sensor histidine kinase regulating citrate/malate metabolism
MVKNSFNGIVEKKGEKIVSSKKDGGLGLPGVHAIVESCDGHVKTEWDESKFTVYVMLNVE